MDTVDALKEQAGIAACEFVKSGMKVGLGTGSTVKYTVIELGRMIKEGFRNSWSANITSNTKTGN